MNTIWKYPIPLEDGFRIEMPEGAEILCIQKQYEMPMMWALVDTNAQMENRTFVTRGTGTSAPAPKDMTYIGTYQQMLGALVWHIFEVTR